MSTFNELDVVRDTAGRFGEHSRTEPEVGLSTALILESPVSDRDSNYWVKLAPGQSAHFDISLDGIEFPGRPYTDDTLDLTLDGDQVVSTYTVADDSIADELAAAFDHFDDAVAAEVYETLQAEISKHTGGRGSVTADGILTHTARHDLDSEGGVYTSNVMGALEGDSAYIYLRDGYYLPTVIATLAKFGYDG